jgi:hypothetical protein
MKWRTAIMFIFIFIIFTLTRPPVIVADESELGILKWASIYLPAECRSKSSEVDTTVSFKCSQEYFSYSGQPIHPKIIEDLTTWLSDGGDQVVSISLDDSQQCNRYFGDIKIKPIEGENPYIFYREEGSYFGYQYLGNTDSGVNILGISESGGGSGIFKSLLFVKIEEDYGITFNDDTNVIKKDRKRILVKKLGSVILGDRYSGELKIEGNRLLIGKDTGDFANGSERNRIIEIDISNNSNGNMSH